MSKNIYIKYHINIGPPQLNTNPSNNQRDVLYQYNYNPTSILTHKNIDKFKLLAQL